MNLNVGRFYLLHDVFFVFVFKSPIITGQENRKGEGGVLSVAVDTTVRRKRNTYLVCVHLEEVR